MNKAKPRDVAVDGRAGELVIAWSDGRESRYDLEGLRRECPLCPLPGIARRTRGRVDAFAARGGVGHGRGAGG